MDRIVIEDFAVRTVLGVHDWERAQDRELLVGLELEFDLTRAGDSDDLADTVDYGALTRRVAAHAATCRFLLLEALATSVAGVVLEEFGLVRAVTVRLEKPSALPTGRVFVEIRRVR